jgi:hypothetical protein
MARLDLFKFYYYSDIRCYMTHAIGFMSVLPDHLHSDNCSVISPGYHLLVLTSPSNYMNREVSTLHHMSTVDTSTESG